MKFLATAFLLLASTAITIDSSKLPPGREQVWIDGNRRVIAERKGDSTVVRIEEEDGRVDTIIISTIGGRLSTMRSNNGVPRTYVPDRTPIIVDGIDIEAILSGPSSGAVPEDVLILPPPKKKYLTGPRFFLCPKDEALLRVPQAEPGKVYKCPVDGTEMKPGKGPDQKIWLLQ